MNCPKCQAKSGDDWSQCQGVCPMPGSPHYDPNWVCREDNRTRPSAPAPAAERWTYSKYRASLYLDGERFAIVTPDGKNALPDAHVKVLLDKLNA